METSATLAEWRGDQVTMYDCRSSRIQRAAGRWRGAGHSARERSRHLLRTPVAGSAAKVTFGRIKCWLPRQPRVWTSGAAGALTLARCTRTSVISRGCGKRWSSAAKADGTLTAIRHEVVNGTALQDTAFGARERDQQVAVRLPRHRTKQLIERRAR